MKRFPSIRPKRRKSVEKVLTRPVTMADIMRHMPAPYTEEEIEALVRAQRSDHENRIVDAVDQRMKDKAAFDRFATVPEHRVGWFYAGSEVIIDLAAAERMAVLWSDIDALTPDPLGR